MSNDSSELADTQRFPNPVVALIMTVGLFLLGQLLATFLVQLLMLLDGRATNQPGLFGSPTLLQFVFGVLCYGLMLAMTIGFMRSRHLSLRDIGLLRPPLSDAGRALVALVVYISVYLTAAAILRYVIPGLDLDQKQDLGFDNAEGVYLVGVFTLLVVIAPFVEEILMRGLLFTSLRQKVPFWLAAVITSVLFAVLHLGGGEQGAGPLWIAAVDTFVLSLVLCYLRERTGRLWAGIGLHMLKNSIAFAALFLITNS